jgi:hypothetical protein
MAWYEITTAEIAPRQPLDSELFNKIRTNFIAALGFVNLSRYIPNGSFEHSTNALPKLWDVTSFTGGSASISTGCHGANSLKITHPGGNGNGGAEVWSQDFIPCSGYSGNITLRGIVWVSGATATAIKGGLAVHTYNSSYELIATHSTNHSNYTTTPTTQAPIFALSTLTRWIKVGCICGTDSTVAGSIYFDALFIAAT